MPKDPPSQPTPGVEDESLDEVTRMRETEETYRQLFELESDAIVLIDNETGLIIEANKAASSLYGYSQEELLELRNTDLSAEEDQTRKVTRTTPPEPDQVISIPLRWHRKKDGTPVPVEITGRFFMHGGRSVHIAAIRDITIRIQAEKEIQRQASFFEQMFAQSSVSTQILDKDGWCERVNPKLCEIFGVAPEHIEGRVYNIFKDEAVRQGGVIPHLEKVFRDGQTAEWEVHFDIGVAAESQNIEVAEKRKVWYHNWAYPIFGDDGELTHVIIQHVDISERKREEEEREGLQAQLLQAQKMESVGRLAGGIAHDFNNMLSVILGHTELAMGEMDPESGLYADLLEIQGAAQRSAELTRQLLAFARMQTVAPRTLDLNNTAATTLTLLRPLIGEDLELVWIPGPSLWPVRMDSAQLDQILANLAVNARDAIQGVGRITIETKNITFDAAFCDDHPGFRSGDFVMMAFSDDGSGMDADTVAHVFEPFFTTKEIGRGTGLGLATVYGIMKQNDGFINVYSEPGQGTTFRLYFPRAQGVVDELEPETGSGALPLQGRGELVLLVEDEVSILEVGRSMLERLGYKVITAGKPGDAIRMAETHEGVIDLLLVDVVMPEMNGRQLADLLKGLRPDLKRLFMSGYTADVIAHHGVLEEGIHFLQKPFSVMELATAVRAALEDA